MARKRAAGQQQVNRMMLCRLSSRRRRCRRRRRRRCRIKTPRVGVEERARLPLHFAQRCRRLLMHRESRRSRTKKGFFTTLAWWKKRRTKIVDPLLLSIWTPTLLCFSLSFLPCPSPCDSDCLQAKEGHHFIDFKENCGIKSAKCSFESTNSFAHFFLTSLPLSRPPRWSHRRECRCCCVRSFPLKKIVVLYLPRSQGGAPVAARRPRRGARGG